MGSGTWYTSRSDLCDDIALKFLFKSSKQQSKYSTTNLLGIPVWCKIMVLSHLSSWGQRTTTYCLALTDGIMLLVWKDNWWNKGQVLQRNRPWLNFLISILVISTWRCLVAVVQTRLQEHRWLGFLSEDAGCRLRQGSPQEHHRRHDRWKTQDKYTKWYVCDRREHTRDGSRIVLGWPVGSVKRSGGFGRGQSRPCKNMVTFGSLETLENTTLSLWKPFVKAARPKELIL